jgi:hypothetical protein
VPSGYLNFTPHYAKLKKINKISVNKAAGYGLGGPGTAVQFPAVERDFSHVYDIQTGSATHRAFYTIHTRDAFCGGGKAAGV